MVRLGYQKSPALRRMLDANKINPARIKTREDLEALPVTSREKLVEMECAPPYAGLENSTIVVTVFSLSRPVTNPIYRKNDFLGARFLCGRHRFQGHRANAFSYHLRRRASFHNGLWKRQPRWFLPARLLADSGSPSAT